MNCWICFDQLSEIFTPWKTNVDPKIWWFGRGFSVQLCGCLASILVFRGVSEKMLQPLFMSDWFFVPHYSSERKSVACLVNIGNPHNLRLAIHCDWVNTESMSGTLTCWEMFQMTCRLSTSLFFCQVPGIPAVCTRSWEWMRDDEEHIDIFNETKSWNRLPRWWEGPMLRPVFQLVAFRDSKKTKPQSNQCHWSPQGLSSDINQHIKLQISKVQNAPRV